MDYLIAYLLVGFCIASYTTRYVKNFLFAIHTPFDFVWTICFWPTNIVYMVFDRYRKAFEMKFLKKYILWLKS